MPQAKLKLGHAVTLLGGRLDLLWRRVVNVLSGEPVDAPRRRRSSNAGDGVRPRLADQAVGRGVAVAPIAARTLQQGEVGPGGRITLVGGLLQKRGGLAGVLDHARTVDIAQAKVGLRPYVAAIGALLQPGQGRCLILPERAQALGLHARELVLGRGQALLGGLAPPTQRHRQELALRPRPSHRDRRERAWALASPYGASDSRACSAP